MVSGGLFYLVVDHLCAAFFFHLACERASERVILHLARIASWNGEVGGAERGVVRFSPSFSFLAFG